MWLEPTVVVAALLYRRILGDGWVAGLAALFFAHYLRTESIAEALSRAASSIFGLLKRTADAGSREILLIDAQDEFVTPSRVFAAEKI